MGKHETNHAFKNLSDNTTRCCSRKKFEAAQVKDSYLELFHPDVKVRCVMAFIVNYILFTMILQTVPLQLIGNQDAIDFVKDCLAIAFIVTLDDRNGPPMRVHLGLEFLCGVPKHPDKID